MIATRPPQTGGRHRAPEPPRPRHAVLVMFLWVVVVAGCSLALVLL
ncbi:hypothetical protein [Nocardia sp. NPDC005745]